MVCGTDVWQIHGASASAPARHLDVLLPQARVEEVELVPRDDASAVLEATCGGGQSCVVDLWSQDEYGVFDSAAWVGS